MTEYFNKTNVRVEDKAGNNFDLPRVEVFGKANVPLRQIEALQEIDLGKSMSIPKSPNGLNMRETVVEMAIKRLNKDFHEAFFVNQILEIGEQVLYPDTRRKDDIIILNANEK